MVKYILDSLKPLNRYIDNFPENSSEYELLCKKVEDHYLEVDEALIGKEQFNQSNLVNAELRRDTYWEYIKEEISWSEFVSEIKTYSNKLLINLD
jgi:hypothetical protein